MMRSLLAVRFRALFAGLMKQGQQKKRKSKGMIVLLAILYLYLAAVICGMMGLQFFVLAEPYHEAGLDWLYFAMAGTMALGLAVFGSVFTTQSQLYDAKDNNLLLVMPIPPAKILLSRMIPLLAVNLLFAAMVMVPATVVYAIWVEFSITGLLAQLLCLMAITILAQAIACGLGWLLHLLLSRVNKSFASVFYMVAFLAIYFVVYSQAGNILTVMAENGASIAGVLQTWVWPLYAMGRGCIDSIVHLMLFTVICAGVFALVYWLLSATFLKTATAKRAGRRRRLDLGSVKATSPGRAIIGKELRRFLGTPVYLTNMGIGLILVAALTVAGLMFRDTLLAQFAVFGDELYPYIPLLIAAILTFVASMICISTPSVSLEGKHLWILKSLPVSSKQILLGKLQFHCILATPLTALAGIALGIGYGCSIPDTLLAGIVPAAATVISGLLGLICDLKWARLDWISEAYPCKQSVSVLIVMFGLMGLPLLLGIAYFALAQFLSPTVFLALATVLLVAVCALLYKALTTWGVKKWEQL